jgi:hypothetical protein
MVIIEIQELIDLLSAINGDCVRDDVNTGRRLHTHESRQADETESEGAEKKYFNVPFRVLGS